MHNLISLDWLTVNFVKGLDFEARISQVPQGFELQRREYGTRHFKDVYTVKFRGVVLGTLVCNPFSSVINPNLVQFKVDNALFYRQINGKIGGYYALQTVMVGLDLMYKSISRLDICVDVEEFDLRGFIEDLRACRIKMKGSRKMQEFYSLVYPKQHSRGGDPPQQDKAGFVPQLVYEGVKFGTAISDYSFKIYDKTKEIAEESYKWYIEDFWRANGWNGATKIFRHEFSIQNVPDMVGVSGLQVTGFSVFDSEIASEVFALYLSKIQCVRNTGKRHSREQLYDFIDVPKAAAILIKKEARKGDNVKTAKVICRNLINDIMQVYDRVVNFSKFRTLIDYIHNYRLADWVNEKFADFWDSVHCNYGFDRYRVAELAGFDLTGEQMLREVI